MFRDPPAFVRGEPVYGGQERDAAEWFAPIPLRRVPAADIWRWRACIRAARNFMKDASLHG